MADKEIIIYKKECYNEPYCSLNQVLEQLKAKEQECKDKSWEIGNLGYKIKNQRKEIDIRLQQLDQLKAENKHLSEKEEEARHYLEEAYKYKQTLAEIKEIAEDFYLDGEHVKNKYLAQEILQKISECEEK